MEGLIITFPGTLYVQSGEHEVPRDVDIAGIMQRLTKVSQEIQLAYDYPDNRLPRQYTVKMKSLWSLDTNVWSALPGELRDEDYREEVSLCGKCGCFNETADLSFGALAGAILFNRCGEEPHAIHQYCKLHCGPMALRIAHTLCVENLTPGETTYWTKVLSWKMRKRYYAQMVEQYEDGDYESGYYTCCVASPFYGPCTTRTEAVDRAKQHAF